MERLTVEQGAIISAFTGILVGNFSDMHRYAARLFGREVWTHDFASEAFAAELKEKARADFMAIQPSEEA